MRSSTKQMNIKVAIGAAVAFSILVTLCGALHAAEKPAEKSKAAPKRTQADVKKIIAEQKTQLAEEKLSNMEEDVEADPLFDEDEII